MPTTTPTTMTTTTPTTMSTTTPTTTQRWSTTWMSTDYLYKPTS